MVTEHSCHSNVQSFTFKVEEDVLNSDCKSKSDVELAAGEPQSELNRKLLALFLDEDDKVSVHSVMAQLKRNGIRPFSDPRLVQMVNKLSEDPAGLTTPNEMTHSVALLASPHLMR